MSTIFRKLLTRAANYFGTKVITNLQDTPQFKSNADSLAKRLWEQTWKRLGGEPSASEIALIRAIRQPARYMPEPSWTKADAAAWEGFLNTQTGKTLDTIMFNFWVQQGFTALHQQQDAIQLHTAQGAWRGWSFAKTLTRITAGENQQPDDAIPDDSPGEDASKS